MDVDVVSALPGIVLPLPELIVVVIGAILALITIRKNGRSSVLALVGFALFVVAGLVLVATGVYIAFLPTLVADRGLSLNAASVPLTILSIVRAILAPVAWLFIILALFSRSTPRGTDNQATP